MPTKNFVW